MGPRTETLSVKLSKEEMADLEQLARVLDRSKGWILREGLKSQRSLLADLRVARERQEDGSAWIGGEEMRRRLGLEG